MSDLDIILDWLRDEGDRLGVPDRSVEMRMRLGHGALCNEIIRVLRVARDRAKLKKMRRPQELLTWLATAKMLDMATREGQEFVAPLVQRYWQRKGGVPTYE